MAFLKFSKGKAIYSVPNGLGDGSAYFDGSSSYADLSDSNLPMGNSARSISLWFYKTSKQNEYTNLIRYGTEYSNYSYSIGINDSGCIETYGCNNTLVYDNEPITLGKWYHVVITFAEDYTEQCFINGTLIDEPKTHDGINTHAEVLCLGNWYGVEYFQGNIKNVNVYNRVLSAEEVTQLYNKQEITSGLVLKVPLTYGKDDDSLFSSKSFIYDYSTLTTSSGFDEFGYPIRYDIASECGISYSTIPVSDGLYMYFPFDGDYKEKKTGIELVPTGNVAFVDGVKKKGVGNNDYSGTYLNGYNPNPIPTEQFTLNLFFKPTNVVAFFATIFEFGSTYSNTGFGLWCQRDNANAVSIRINNSNTNVGASQALEVNKWHMLTFTFDGTTGRVYTNGVLVASRSFSKPNQTNTIGMFNRYAESQQGGADNGIPSCVDEVSVYNRVLTQDEINKWLELLPKEN